MRSTCIYSSSKLFLAANKRVCWLKFKSYLNKQRIPSPAHLGSGVLLATNCFLHASRSRAWPANAAEWGLLVARVVLCCPSRLAIRKASASVAPGGSTAGCSVRFCASAGRWSQYFSDVYIPLAQYHFSLTTCLRAFLDRSAFAVRSCESSENNSCLFRWAVGKQIKVLGRQRRAALHF